MKNDKFTWKPNMKWKIKKLPKVRRSTMKQVKMPNIVLGAVVASIVLIFAGIVACGIWFIEWVKGGGK